MKGEERDYYKENGDGHRHHIVTKWSRKEKMVGGEERHLKLGNLRERNEGQPGELRCSGERGVGNTHVGKKLA